MRFKIDCASLIVRRKFTILALCYFVAWGLMIWRGNLTVGFLRCKFGGACIWRGLYMEELIFGTLR